MKIIVAILSILLVGCYNRYSAPEAIDDINSTNATIAALKQMCDRNILTFTDNAKITITGTVLSCDKEGFISNALYIDDGTATAKVLTGIYNAYVIYPEGSQISIYLPALSAKIENYQLVIGMTDDRDNSKLAEMDSQVILDKHITRHSTLNSVEPQLCAIYELTTFLCGKLVRLSDMTFIDTYEDEQNPAGKYCTLCDTKGNFAYLYIDPYSMGYNKPLPKDAVDITAIVTYGYIPQINSYGIILIPRRCSDISL